MNIKLTNFIIFRKKVINFIILLSFIIVFSPDFIFGKSNQGEIIRKNDEILVKFKDEKTIQKIILADGENIDNFINSLKDLDIIEYAEPNFLYKASLLPNDSNYSNQWYLTKVRAFEAWDYLRESPDIVIAIIDSGVQITHHDLIDNIWVNEKEIKGNNIDDDKNGYIDDVNGWDFVNNVNDPSPKFTEGFTEAGVLHGTIVAGIAAASGNNAAGIAGITWKAELMPLKVLDDKGEGDTDNVVKAIYYAINKGADIINLSFVGFGYSRSLNAAIKDAYDAGVIVVAAAGNELNQGQGYDLDKTPMYPACNEDSNENRVIGVAATDTMDQKANFSSYGKKCVDISSPGISIYSTSVYEPTEYYNERPFNRYYDGYWSGTSMAAPIVSGALALLEQANPSLDHKEIIKILLDTSDNISKLNPNYSSSLGKGRININSAVAAAQAELKRRETKVIVSPFSYASKVGTSTVLVNDALGKMQSNFNPYEANFSGGINIATGDLNGDGFSEIVTSVSSNGQPLIKIFDQKYKLLNKFLAYTPKFLNGVNIALGDINGDGKDEIITSPKAGGGPHVKVFDINGKLILQFFAYDKKFYGGVNIASGDIDGDGFDEIITGPGKGGGPHIRSFNSSGVLESQFFAYDKNFKGGVNVITADIKVGARGNKDKIITAPFSSGSAHIRMFDNYNNLEGEFYAFKSNFRGGVNLASGDINNDGLDELIIGAGPGGSPHVKIFKPTGELVSSFYAYDSNFSGGVNVSILNIIK